MNEWSYFFYIPLISGKVFYYQRENPTLLAVDQNYKQYSILAIDFYSHLNRAVFLCIMRLGAYV